MDFNATELRVISTALRAFYPHEEIKDLVEKIQEKIAQCHNIINTKSYFEKVTKRLESNPAIKIALLSENDFPVFRFVECPTKLSTRGMLGRASIGDVILSKPSHGHGDFYVDSPGIERHGHLYLTNQTSEVLAAFIMYHKLKERGIQYSGLNPSEEGTPGNTTTAAGREEQPQPQQEA